MANETYRLESLEEMVFKTRNKEYGAYILRKKYQKYVTISLIIALITIGAAVAYPVIAAYINKNNRIVENKDVETQLLDIPKEDLPPPPPPPPPPEAIVEKVKFTAPVVTSDSVETNLVSQDDLNAKPNVEAPTEETTFEPVEEKTQVIEQAAPKEIFTVVEEQPGYPGGDEARMKYLQENTKYPEEAKELGVQGKVFVTFVVEVDGSITDVRVLRGIGAGCDEEAVRVVKSMPRWIPGKQRGVPVRVQFNLPIKFTLQG
ncbi:MAG: energy transducer TonB [Syntrophothermus sp.]